MEPEESANKGGIFSNNRKTIVRSGGVASVVIFFILLFVFAKWGPTINFSTTTQTKGNPFVVSGQGKVLVTPDIAKISFGIQESGSSLKTVQTSVNTKSKSLTAALSKLGIADADIKTTSYNVYPQYDYNNSTPRVTGFQVSTEYEVTVKNFDIVNEALVAGTAAGANTIGGINFEVNDATQKEKLQEARKLAVADAKEKATGLSSASGITLGKIINISENQSNPFPIRELALPVAGGGDAKAAPQPNIQPGQTEINVTVSLSYEVR